MALPLYENLRKNYGIVVKDFSREMVYARSANAETVLRHQRRGADPRLRPLRAFDVNDTRWNIRLLPRRQFHLLRSQIHQRLTNTTTQITSHSTNYCPSVRFLRHGLLRRGRISTSASNQQDFGLSKTLAGFIPRWFSSGSCCFRFRRPSP